MTDADPDTQLLVEQLDEIRAAIASPLIPPRRAERIRDACRRIECELDPAVVDDVEQCDACARVGLPEQLAVHVCRPESSL